MNYKVLFLKKKSNVFLVNQHSFMIDLPAGASPLNQISLPKHFSESHPDRLTIMDYSFSNHSTTALREGNQMPRIYWWSSLSKLTPAFDTCCPSIILTRSPIPLDWLTGWSPTPMVVRSLLGSEAKGKLNKANSLTRFPFRTESIPGPHVLSNLHPRSRSRTGCVLQLFRPPSSRILIAYNTA